VKASDVAFSLMRVKTMPAGLSFADAIAEVVPVDDQTVNVILSMKSAAAHKF
jgi:ABC-type transport system substrate-binding protein